MLSRGSCSRTALGGRRGGDPAALAPSSTRTQRRVQRPYRRRIRCPAASGVGVGGDGDGFDIRIIASDVDGTLVNSKQQLTPGVEAAVRRAEAAGVPVSEG